MHVPEGKTIDSGQLMQVRKFKQRPEPFDPFQVVLRRRVRQHALQYRMPTFHHYTTRSGSRAGVAQALGLPDLEDGIQKSRGIYTGERADPDRG